jgi:CTP:molybdopterin cytidylyltransferase MocA
MGRPKALVELAGRPLLARALDALRDGGCDPLTVVLGAAAEQVAASVPVGVLVVNAADWAEGMGASLRAGLDALGRLDTEAALVHLVDLPGIGAPVISRLIAEHVTPRVLARAVYHGIPGHPVLLGRDHWPGVREVALGDAGARDYLAGHPALHLVECGELADPADVDTPAELRRFRSIENE